MKIIHTADLHLGMQPDRGHPWSQARSQDLWNALTHIIDTANQQEADLLLIAGDLFHHPPLLRDLKEVNALFDTLTTARVVMIAGNHDPIRPRSQISRFVWSDHVTLLSDAQMESVYFEDLNAQIHGFSYPQTEIPLPVYDCLQAPRDGRIHILLGHGGDDRHAPIHLSRLAAAGFHYAALGHIHKPELHEDLRLAWCGSPEPMDLTDIGHRGFILAQVDTRQTKLTFLPCCQVQYVPLTLHVTPDTTRTALARTLQQKIDTLGPQHIYLVTLTGERDPDLDLTTPVPVQGRLVRWVDHTDMALDYSRLRQDHDGDLLGAFLSHMESLPSGPIQEKAMAYVVRACLQKGGRP